MTLLYNLIMGAVDLAVLFLVFVGRKKSRLAWCASVACAATVALVLAIKLGEDRFGSCRLAAWGLFFHGVVVLIGSAVLWWRRSRVISIGSAICAAILLAIAVDAFLIEPTWLEVSYRQIPSEKIERPIRIVVLADLQTDRIGEYERSVLRRVAEEKPDLILLVGDYVQVPWPERQGAYDQLNALLDEIDFGGSAKVFAVEGNVDWPDWYRIYDGLDVTTVRRTRSFELDGLRLTCLGLPDSYDSSLTITNHDPDRFHLVVGHVPNFALGPIQADLLVAGHTHGGQVRLPLIGPLTTHSELPNHWAAGLTELPGGGRLLIPRGVGMERKYAPRLRFFCRPELAVVDLVPAGR